jgi:hypothetical protein
MTAAPGGTAINMPPIAATPVSTIEAQAILYQSQAVLAQTQQLQAQMQQTLLRLQARGREDDDAAGELNMLSIGLKAFWSQIRYRVGRLFGRKDPA